VPFVTPTVHSSLHQPSEQDKTLTRAFVLAAETIHLKILNHLIVLPGEVFGFRKAGLL
jgi:DNA repair protein RadC